MVMGLFDLRQRIRGFGLAQFEVVWGSRRTLGFVLVQTRTPNLVTPLKMAFVFGGEASNVALGWRAARWRHFSPVLEMGRSGPAGTRKSNAPFETMAENCAADHWIQNRLWEKQSWKDVTLM